MQKKKKLQLLHDTTFSDHTRVSMWKFMNAVWRRKWVVWHMDKWSYIIIIMFLKG